MSLHLFNNKWMYYKNGNIKRYEHGNKNASKTLTIWNMQTMPLHFLKVKNPIREDHYENKKWKVNKWLNIILHIHKTNVMITSVLAEHMKVLSKEMVTDFIVFKNNLKMKACLKCKKRINLEETWQTYTSYWMMNIFLFKKDQK